MPTESTPGAGSRQTFSRRYVSYAIALLFLVSVMNVVDRFILSILAPEIKHDLGLSDTRMGILLGPSFSVVHFLAVIPAAWQDPLERSRGPRLAQAAGSAANGDRQCVK